MKYVSPGLARLFRFANFSTVEWRGEGALVLISTREAYIDCIGDLEVSQWGETILSGTESKRAIRQIASFYPHSF